MSPVRTVRTVRTEPARRQATLATSISPTLGADLHAGGCSKGAADRAAPYGDHHVWRARRYANTNCLALECLIVSAPATSSNHSRPVKRTCI